MNANADWSWITSTSTNPVSHTRWRASTWYRVIASMEGNCPSGCSTTFPFYKFRLGLYLLLHSVEIRSKSSAHTSCICANEHIVRWFIRWVVHGSPDALVRCLQRVLVGCPWNCGAELRLIQFPWYLLEPLKVHLSLQACHKLRHVQNFGYTASRFRGVARRISSTLKGRQKCKSPRTPTAN
jgi:hypothetical protein